MGQSKHDQIANRIAKKEGTTYNEGQGPDVQNSKRVIEVSASNVVSRMKRTVGNVPDGMWGRLPSLASGQALVSLATLTRPLFVNIDPTPCRLLMTD